MTYPDVKLSRPDGFWKTSGVDDSPGKIECSHWYQGSKRCKGHRFVITFGYYVVNYWNTTAQSKCHESPYRKHITTLIINVSYNDLFTLASLLCTVVTAVNTKQT